MPYGPPEAVSKRVLFHRFKLTIATQMPVIVHHADVMAINEQRTIGIPFRITDDVLFLKMSNGNIKAIPKAVVINIQGIF